MNFRRVCSPRSPNWLSAATRRATGSACLDCCGSGGSRGWGNRGHSSRSSAPRGMGAVTAFDFLPVDVGFDTLLARSELLITGQSYDGRHAPLGGRSQDMYAKGYLDSLGIVASEMERDELRGRVLRLTRPNRDLEPRELADVARSLQNFGLWRLSTT